jgi:hypothetical protein
MIGRHAYGSRVPVGSKTRVDRHRFIAHGVNVIETVQPLREFEMFNLLERHLGGISMADALPQESKLSPAPAPACTRRRGDLDG